MDLNVRKGGVRDWKDAAAFGVEVYRDPNTACVIYISETGSVAVLPEKGESNSRPSLTAISL